MSSVRTLAAAQACGYTLLFESINLQRFQGAVPHVMLVVDPEPNSLQKLIVEGYRLAMDAANSKAAANPPLASVDASTFLIPLPATSASSGASGLDSADNRISYSLLPFVAAEFVDCVEQVQRFLRQCGPSCGEGEERWSDEAFSTAFEKVARYLAPLNQPEYDHQAYCRDLRNGPNRELLAFILIQRSAFQNDLHQYRLRLSLFDRGARVVEHCHLNSMSEPADAIFASTHSEEATLADDQLYSYCRSCAFSPTVAEPFAKAIAESIDLYAWKRGAADVSSDPPPSLAAALQNDAIWTAFQRDLITYNGISGSALAASHAAQSQEMHNTYKESPITGAGAPLVIQCRDPSKQLIFSGGLEDCLMNTGFYVASLEPQRNELAAHRLRFPLPEAAAATANEEATSAAAPEQHPEVMGRMKKKDYLEMLKKRGEKPNKDRKRPHGADDEAEAEGAVRFSAGSRINSSIGGTFPIGEVISEAFDLSKLNGTCDVFAFPDNHKNVAFATPQPFQMRIAAGRVVELSEGAPSEFVELWTLVKQTEGECFVRELGIGLNPYLSRQHVLADVTSFERQWGVHLSLGLRHPLFVKQQNKKNPDGSVAPVPIDGPVVKRKAGKYHIDVFVDAASLKCGGLAVDFTVPIASS